MLFLAAVAAWIFRDYLPFDHLQRLAALFRR